MFKKINSEKEYIIFDQFQSIEDKFMKGSYRTRRDTVGYDIK